MKKILLILLVSLAAFNSAYSQNELQYTDTLPHLARNILYDHLKIDTVVILNGDETIKVGDSVYSLKELIEAKKKNEVLEEMLQKRVSRNGLDDSTYNRCSKLFYVDYDGVIIKSIEVKH